MTSLADIERAVETVAGNDTAAAARRLLAAGEATLGLWLEAHGETPTTDTREGFRLLALHRQCAKDLPSFNACRETCRELVYHYNLLCEAPGHGEAAKRIEMMRFVATHLLLFVGGKLEQAALGDFCCASRPLREAG